MNNLEHVLTSSRLILFGVVLSINTGCTSFNGATLGEKGDIDNLAGIPYRMVRPEFILTRTPPATGSKTLGYTLEYSYVPDPTHIYMLQLDPTLFTDPEFTMKLGTGSTLLSTKAGFTDQVVPTISAVGSFLVNLASSAAIIADKSDNSLMNQISTAIKKSGEDECQKPSEVVHFTTNKERTISIADELTNRIDQFKSDEVFSAQFHYINESERSCLKKANSSFIKSDEKELKTAKEEYEKLIANYVNNPSHIESNLRKIKDSIDNSDIDTLNHLLDECDGDSAELKDRCNLIAGGLDYLTSKNKNDSRNLLEKIVNLDGNPWRARHLLYLEREIDAIAIQSLKSPKNKVTFDKGISVLRAQRAETIGATDLYIRAELISKFLKKIPTKNYSHGGEAPSVADYTGARGELDETLKQIDDRRARLLSDAKPAQSPTPPPPPPINVKYFLAKDFDKNKVDTSSPEFVIVLEEIQE